MAAIGLIPTLDKPSFTGSLPPEIADIVCSKLETPDVANLRLVSSYWMNVATPWLLPEVHLIFKRDSFQRLIDISNHPVIRHHVTSLFYEPDTLWTYHSQDEWAKGLSDPRDFRTIDFPSTPEPGATEREQRVYRREMARLLQPPKRRHTKEDLCRAYSEYVRLYNDQEQLRQENYGAAAILEAMSRFPRLLEICMSLGCNIVTCTDYVNQAYGTSWNTPSGDGGHLEPSGVAQMRSLLLGAARTDVRLRRLELGDVNWTFLQADEEVLEQMKKSIEHLKCLNLVISTGMDEAGDEIGVEIPECRKYLENGCLRDFLTAAPALEDLALDFDWYKPYCPTEMKHVVGDFTWSCLRNVAFENIDTSDQDWVAFFVRHAPTLRDVTIQTIRLTSGSWPVVLEQMSRALKLETAYFRGDLLSSDPTQRWNLEPALWAEYSDLRDQGNRTRVALGDFLVSGGTCPLLDEEAHPQFW